MAAGDTLPSETALDETAPDREATRGRELVRGDTIGRFVVIAVLGTGGMGVVYSAYDPHLDRKVALKLLRSAVAEKSDDALVRMLREAQAMAKIHHPNVITVHDVGTHRDQVYIAMEFADGGTLRAWLAKQRRTRHEILDVFVQAGRGLAAAHAAGLIHRDFKPDNVLISTDGRARVTDFGLVGVERGSVTTRAPTAPPVPITPVPSLPVNTPLSSELTRTGSIMGTPLYMAPEQFTGGSATSSTDQFSFCVALYEAIYGAHPFGGATFAELAMSVTGGAIVAPARAANVPGSLRHVLVRGLARDPAERFPSMAAVLDELARGRSARRTRLAAGAGIAVAAAAATMIFALWPGHRVTCDGGTERFAKIWNPDRRRHLEAAFLASQRPHAAATVARLGAMFDAWGMTWSAGHRDACMATRVSGVQSEHVLDLRMQCLTSRLDEAAAMLDLLEAGGGEAVDHALDAVMQLPTIAQCSAATELEATVRPPDTEAARARVHEVEAKLDAARAQDRLGRYTAARDVAKAAVGAARETGYRPVIAAALLELGTTQLELADRAAIDNLREANHLARAAGDLETEIVASGRLVTALTSLAGKFDVAAEVSDLADAAAAGGRTRAELALPLAVARAKLDTTRGQPGNARARLEPVLAAAERELGPDHANILAADNELASALKAAGDFEGARRLYERVLATRERLDGPDHPDVANALNNLGDVLRAEDKLEAAKQLYDRALAIRIAALGAEHPQVADSYNSLGGFYAQQGDRVAARKYFEKALALDEKVFGRDSVELANVVTNLGSMLVELGERDAARAALTRARRLYEHGIGAEDEHVAYVIAETALIDEREGKADQALAAIREAEQLAVKALGPDHPVVGDYLEREVEVLEAQRELAEAEAVATRAVDVFRSAYGGDHSRVAMALATLARIQGERGNYKTALDTWEQSVPIFEARLGKNHPNLSFALAGIGDALTELGRPDEALPYIERALQIRTDARMPHALTAEVHFYLGNALVRRSATRARAFAEIQTALAQYREAHDEANVREMQAWLAKHR